MSEKELQDSVEVILAELREQVQARRGKLAGEEAGVETGYDLSLSELRTAVQEISDNWHISAHLPILWNQPVIGRFGAYTKRLVRLLLRWYINPIVEQQNNYNEAVARAIVQLTAYQDRMSRQWQLMDERLDRIEEQLSEQAAAREGN